MAKSKQKREESQLRYTVAPSARAPGFVILDNVTNMQHSGPFADKEDAREKARKLNSREAASITAAELRRLD